MGQLIEQQLTHAVIGAFYDVYNELGYGFLEHVYVRAMARELATRGLQVAREAGVQVYYKGEPLTTQRLDLVVERRLVVEIKSGLELPKTARRQLYSYLRATNIEVGLLLHFGARAEVARVIRPNDVRQASPTGTDVNG